MTRVRFFVCNPNFPVLRRIFSPPNKPSSRLGNASLVDFVPGFSSRAEGGQNVLENTCMENTAPGMPEYPTHT